MDNNLHRNNAAELLMLAAIRPIQFVVFVFIRVHSWTRSKIIMGLFKSKDERRIEREMKIRGGMRAIEKSIRQQEKFAEDFIKNAQHARKIGDEHQYQFIRSALKKTAAVKKMLERQLLAIKNAMLIQQQAQASQQFAESMNLMAQEIGRTFSEMDLTQTQAQWERAVAQAGSIEERMDVFLDSMEQIRHSGRRQPPAKAWSATKKSTA